MIRKLLVAAAVLIVVVMIAVALFARGIIGNDAVRRTLEDQLSSRLGEPVTIKSLGASFFPRVTLNLRDVSAGQPPKAAIGEIAVRTGLRGLLSKRVEDAAVIVSNARVPAPMLAAIVGGMAGGSSSSSSGFSIVSVGTLALRQVELAANQRSLLVDLESSINGDRLDVTRLSAQSAGTRLDAHGALTSIAKVTGSFTAKANQLNLDELLAIVASFASPSTGAADSGGPSTPLDVTIDLTAPSGDVVGYSFQNLSSVVRLTSTRVLVQPARFDVFGGAFDGSLRVTSSDPPAVALSGRISNIDVATLLKIAAGSTSMTGRLGGTVTVASRALTGDEVMRRARGSSQIAITNGSIPGLEMVRAIVLAFGKPSGAPPPGSGSAFSRLGGTFSLADQVLRSEDVVFESRDFDMAGRVTIRLPSGAVEMHANVVLSRELTEQAGTDLRRYAQEDGRVVVPAIITGTIASPSVSIDIAAAVSRALQNEVKRKLKGLFDRIIR
jgi:hypothetical protein